MSRVRNMNFCVQTIPEIGIVEKQQSILRPDLRRFTCSAVPKSMCFGTGKFMCFDSYIFASSDNSKTWENLLSESQPASVIIKRHQTIYITVIDAVLSEEKPICLKTKCSSLF